MHWSTMFLNLLFLYKLLYCKNNYFNFQYKFDLNWSSFLFPTQEV